MNQQQQSQRKTIGSMNGPWAIMAKVCMASYPIVMGALLTWGAWITAETLKNESFRDAGPRVTTDTLSNWDKSRELRLLEEVNKTRANVLTVEWGKGFEGRLIGIEKSTARLELLVEQLVEQSKKRSTTSTNP